MQVPLVFADTCTVRVRSLVSVRAGLIEGVSYPLAYKIYKEQRMIPTIFCPR